MGQSTVALIHAVIPAMPPMRETLARELPEVRVLNLLDEGLLSEVERRGGLTPDCVDRLATQVGLGIQAGAQAVLLTCTAYSPVVDQVQARFPETPVLGVDQVMVDQAVERASRIGVLATVPAGLEQQRASLERAAARIGKQIEIVPSLHPQAMAALNAGDADAHDRILLEALPALAQQVELVLLAQASMARLLPKLPADLPVPVLASPQLAVARLREVLSTASPRTS
jgi:Asp/Glu/hydantoin racemase